VPRPWVAIQRNPTSGSGRRNALLLELVEHLRRAGLRPRLFASRERLDRVLSDEQQRDELVGIVAAGGDGTVGDIINRFPGTPIAILPLGTENLLARYLHIPASGQAVAEMIAAGRRRQIDLCSLGERRFTIMASFGFDADVVHRTHSRRRGHIRKWHYVQPILQSLRTYTYPELRIFADDDPDPIVARLAVLVNLPMYAIGLPVARSAVADDGLVDLRLFEQGSTFAMAHYFYKLTTGGHEALQDVRSGRAARVRIESDEAVPIQIDGDPAGCTPAEVRVLPGELDVFVPDVSLGSSDLS